MTAERPSGETTIGRCMSPGLFAQTAAISSGLVTRGHELSRSIFSAPSSSTRATFSRASSFGDFLRKGAVSNGASADSSVASAVLDAASLAS